MTSKNAANLHDERCEDWAPPQNPENEGTALKTKENHNPRSRAGQLWKEVPMTYDTLLWPPALRRLLDSDGYQIAFLPATAHNHSQTSEEEPYPTEAPAALLPLTCKELIAKVCESVRNFYSVSGEAVTGFADVCVNFAKMEVSRAGENVRLTAQEFKTLKFLMQNAERVISRDELLNEAWGYQNYPSTRTVDNHILKLRQKLEKDPARPIHFLTIPRVGYKFVP
jgi:hypothetical protein